MFEITNITGGNAYQASHYFAGADDYYTKESAGEWYGKGAAALGLEGDVNQTQLSRLFQGQLPNGDKMPGTRTKDSERRMGLDCTISAPKSISMQALIAGDKRILEAHDRAVAKTLEDVEKHAITRKKENKISHFERTGNLVIAACRHEMSRDKDPQLHTHAVILNMTQRSDGKWRSLVNDDFFLIKKEMDAVYKNALAYEVQKLGYQIRLTDGEGNFELAHISREQIEAFSNRSKVIEEALSKKGLTRDTATAEEKQKIALNTRKRKDERDKGAIKRDWVERSQRHGIDYNPPRAMAGSGIAGSKRAGGGIAESGSPGGPAVLPADMMGTAGQVGQSRASAQAIVKYAINHLTEREAVVSQSDLMEMALKRGVGIVTKDDVTTEINRQVKDGSLLISEPTYKLVAQVDKAKHAEEKTVRGWQAYMQEQEGLTTKDAKARVEKAIKSGSLMMAGQNYTTSQARKREKAILAIERDGRAALKPVIAPQNLKRLGQDLTQTLNAGQKQAIAAMLATGNRFVGVQGDAGTGKTYTVKKALDMVDRTNGETEINARERRNKVLKRIAQSPILTKKQKATMVMNAGPKYEAKATDLWRVTAVAPYGNQVKALKEEGMKADTLASFVNHKTGTAIDAKTIVILDEAGVVPAKQMVQLMKKIESKNSRLVMMGDTKQMAAIEAGKPFQQLQDAGMHTKRIHEIQRQTNLELKKAVELAADSKVNSSLQKIKTINTIPDDAERHQAIVKDYMNQPEQDRRESLILVATNSAKKEINAGVREALGLLGKGHNFESLVREDMTAAQRGYAPSYKVGQVLMPEKNFKKQGLTANQPYRVLKVLPDNKLRIAPVDKQKDPQAAFDINPKSIASSTSIYKTETSEFAPGDVLRVNRKIKKYDLTLGDHLKVESTVGDKGLVVTPIDQSGCPKGKSITLLHEQKPMPLEHSYACTIHSSQGLTRKKTFLDLPSKGRMPSTNLYYVGVSRAKEDVTIYTDDHKRLPGALSDPAVKTAALELNRARLQRDRLQRTRLQTQKSTPIDSGIGGRAK